MGQDTEELKQDIEETRADMSATLEAIGDRVSPGRMVQRKKNRVASGIQTVRDRVMGTVSDSVHSTREAVSGAAGDASDSLKHAPEALAQRTGGAPMIAGAIAFGVGFLIAAAFAPTDPEKETSAKLMDTLEPVKDEVLGSVHEMADHLKEPATAAAQNLKDAATSAATEVVSSAKDSADHTKQAAEDSIGNVKANAAPQ